MARPCNGQRHRRRLARELDLADPTHSNHRHGTLLHGERSKPGEILTGGWGAMQDGPSGPSEDAGGPEGPSCILVSPPAVVRLVKNPLTDDQRLPDERGRTSADC